MERQHKSGWRGIWPLVCWLFLFLLLYGIRLNQKLLEQTRLYFSISLNGQPLAYPITVTRDGKPVQSGDKISLGDHHFAIIGPKTDSFATNLFVFYGSHNLGEIRLVRSMGTLSVKADPPAQTITVSGPEFSTNLQGSSSADLTVPADSYTVNAKYPRWSGSQTIRVTSGSISPITFSPKFCSVSLTCNRDGATFKFQNANGQIQESGDLPAMVSDLPPGEYEATAIYHGRTMLKSVHAEAGETNEVLFQFLLGALRLETTPGAEVRTADGNYLGQTPLVLPDMSPQTAQLTLTLSGYEPVSVALDVTADRTNVYATNLVSVSYLSAMQDARVYLSASNYEAAFQAADEAVKAKPGDADALAIFNQAGDVLKANQEREERLQRPKKWFDTLCGDYPDANLFAEHELQTTKPAADVAVEIVASMTNSPSPFKIVRTNSPETDTYEIVARQMDILGASERDCLIVVGRANDVETEIRFKVLDFQIQNTFVGNGLLNLHDDKRLIPMTPDKIQNNSLLEYHVREGLKNAVGKIKEALASRITR